MKLLKVENNPIGIFNNAREAFESIRGKDPNSVELATLEDKTKGFLDFMAYRQWWLFDGYNLANCASWFLEFLKPEAWEDVHVHYLKQNDGKMCVYTNKYFANVTKLF